MNARHIFLIGRLAGVNQALDLSPRLTTTEAPQIEAERSQTRCQRWHQSYK